MTSEVDDFAQAFFPELEGLTLQGMAEALPPIDLGKSPSEETSKLLARDVASLAGIQIDFSQEFLSKYDEIQQNVDKAMMEEMGVKVFHLKMKDAMKALHYDIDSISLLTKSFHGTVASLKTWDSFNIPGDFCNEGLRSSRLQIGFDAEKNNFSRLSTFPSFKIAEIPITLRGSVTMQVYAVQIDPQHQFEKKTVRYAPVELTQLISIICNMTKMFISGNVQAEVLIQEINNLPARNPQKSMLTETLGEISTQVTALPKRASMKRIFDNAFWFGHEFKGRGLHSFQKDEAIVFIKIFDLVSNLLLNGFIECFPYFLKKHQSHLFDSGCRPKEKSGQNTEQELTVQTPSEPNDNSTELNDTVLVDERFMINVVDTLSMIESSTEDEILIPFPESYEIHCKLVRVFIQSLLDSLQWMIDNEFLPVYNELLERITNLVDSQQKEDLATIHHKIMDLLLRELNEDEYCMLLVTTEDDVLAKFIQDIRSRSNPGTNKAIDQEAQLSTKQAFIALWGNKQESYKVQPQEKNQEKQLENSANRNTNPITQQKDNTDKYKAARAAYRHQREKERKSFKKEDNRNKLQHKSTYDYDSRKETKRMQYVRKILRNPKKLSTYAKETLPNLYFHSQKAGCKNMSPKLELSIDANPEERKEKYETFLLEMHKCLHEFFDHDVLSLDDNNLFIDIAMEGELKEKYSSFVASLLLRPNGEYTNELGVQTSKKFYSRIGHHDYMFAMHPYATNKHSSGMKYHLVSGKFHSQYFNRDKGQWKTEGRLAGINFYNAGAINLFHKYKLEHMSLSELPFLFQTHLARGNGGLTLSEQVAFDECINSINKLQMFKSCHSLSNTKSLELRLEQMVDLTSGITSDVLNYNIENVLDTDLILIPRANIFFRNIASIQKCIELVRSTVFKSGESYFIDPKFWQYEEQKKAIRLTSIEFLATYFPGEKQSIRFSGLTPHLKQLKSLFMPLHLPLHMPLSDDHMPLIHDPNDLEHPHKPVFQFIAPILFTQTNEEIVASLCEQSTDENPSPSGHNQWCKYFNELITNFNKFVQYDGSGKSNHALRLYMMFRTIIQKMLTSIFDDSAHDWSVWENLFIVMLRMQVFSDSTSGSSSAVWKLAGILHEDTSETWHCDSTVNNIDMFFKYLLGEREEEDDDIDLSGTGWQTYLPLLLYYVTYRHIMRSNSDAHYIIKYHIICACKRYCAKKNSSIFLFHSTKSKRRKRTLAQKYHIVNNDIFNYETMEDYKEETKARERKLNPPESTSNKIDQLNKDLFFLNKDTILQVLTLATFYNALIFSEEEWKNFYAGTPPPQKVSTYLCSLLNGKISLRSFENNTSLRLKKFSQIQSICDSKIIPTFLEPHRMAEVMKNIKRYGRNQMEDRYNLVKSISFRDCMVLFHKGDSSLQFTVEDIKIFAETFQMKKIRPTFIDYITNRATKNASTPSLQPQGKNSHSGNVIQSNKRKVSFVKDSIPCKQIDFNKESYITATATATATATPTPKPCPHPQPVTPSLQFQPQDNPSNQMSPSFHPNQKPCPHPQPVTPSLQFQPQDNPSNQMSPSFHDSCPSEQIESDETFMSPTSDHASHPKTVTPYTNQKNDMQDDLASSSFTFETSMSTIQNRFLKTRSVATKLIEESQSIQRHNSLSRFSQSKSPIQSMKLCMKNHEAISRDSNKICDDLRQLEEDDTFATLNFLSHQSKNYSKTHSDMLSEIGFPIGNDQSFYTDEFIKEKAKLLAEKEGLHLGLLNPSKTIESYTVQMQWCRLRVFHFGTFHDKELAYFVLLFAKSRNNRKAKSQAGEYYEVTKKEAIKRLGLVYGDARVRLTKDSPVKEIYTYAMIMAQKRNEKLVGIAPISRNSTILEVRYKFMGKERNFGRINSSTLTLPMGIFLIKVLQLDDQDEDLLDDDQKETYFHQKREEIRKMLFHVFRKKMD